MTNLRTAEHSLRHSDAGLAYMIMLDVYSNCKRQGVALDAVMVEIDRANPWRESREDLQRAWRYALSEFCADHQLPPPSPLLATDQTLD